MFVVCDLLTLLTWVTDISGGLFIFCSWMMDVQIALLFTDMDFKNIALTVAGWGKTRQGAMTSSRYLLETKVKMVDGEKCRKSAIYRDNLVTDTMMCAYSLGKDACQVSISSQKTHTTPIDDEVYTGCSWNKHAWLYLTNPRKPIVHLARTARCGKLTSLILGN